VKKKQQLHLSLKKPEESSLIKYAAIFVLGLGLAGSVVILVYQNQIASNLSWLKPLFKNKFKIKFKKLLFY
jgi:hypothetical protein